MTAFVLDCSVAVSWCFKDEAGPETDALLDLLVEEGATVPDLWRIELANVLLQAERRGRIDRSEIGARLRQFRNLPISIDLEPGLERVGEILDLARQHRLTAYDAIYLDLAIRSRLPLATMDKALIAACARTGVKTLPDAAAGRGV